MSHLGLDRRAGETPGQFAQRSIAALPAFSEQLEQIARLYNELAYSRDASSEQLTVQALDEFVSAVKAFKPDRRRAVTDENVIV